MNNSDKHEKKSLTGNFSGVILPPQDFCQKIFDGLIWPDDVSDLDISSPINWHCTLIPHGPIKSEKRSLLREVYRDVSKERPAIDQARLKLISPFQPSKEDIILLGLDSDSHILLGDYLRELRKSTKAKKFKQGRSNQYLHVTLARSKNLETTREFYKLNRGFESDPFELVPSLAAHHRRTRDLNPMRSDYQIVEEFPFQG